MRKLLLIAIILISLISSSIAQKIDTKANNKKESTGNIKEVIITGTVKKVTSKALLENGKITFQGYDIVLYEYPNSNIFIEASFLNYIRDKLPLDGNNVTLTCIELPYGSAKDYKVVDLLFK